MKTLASLALIFLVAAGCGLQGSSGLPVGATTPKGSTVLASQQVGTNGGTVQVADSASPLYQTSVGVPAGALLVPTTVSVADASQATALPALPSALVGVGEPVELGPDGTVFLQPVQVGLSYTDAKLAAAGVTDESALQIVASSAASAQWEYLTIISRDAVANRIVGQTSHFSFFRIVAPRPAGGNRPASASVATPAGTITGDVTISYVLSDPDNDLLRLTVEYLAGATATTALPQWRPAAVTGATLGLTPGAGSLIWHSAVDAPGLQASDYVLRLTPHDGTAQGVAAVTGLLTIDNTGGGTTNNGWAETLTATHLSGAAVDAGNPALPGQALRLRCRTTNNTGRPQTLTYASGQQYDFWAVDSAGVEVWRWSNGMAFTMISGTRTVNAGETITSDVTWNVVDNAGVPLTGGAAYTVFAQVAATASPDALGAGATLALTLGTGSGGTSGALTATVTTEDQSGNAATTFVPGDTIVFKCTLTNGSTQTQTITYSGGCFQRYNFQVTDAAGNVVWSPPVPMCAPPPPGYTTNAQPDVLAPGASLTYTGQWATTAGDPATGAPATPAGSYTGQFSLLGSASPGPTPALGAATVTLQSGGSTSGNTLTGTLALRDSTGAAVTSAQPGQSLTWELTLTNPTGATQTLSFNTGQQFDFMVTNIVPPGSLQPNVLYWQWSYGRAFIQAFTTLTLQPGQSQVFTASWNVSDNSGALLGAGQYSCSASVPHNATGSAVVGAIAPVTLTVGAGGGTGGLTYSLVAKDASGTIAGTFPIGATVTLEYTVTNNSTAAVTLGFPSGQQYDFQVVGPSGAQVWLWSASVSFTQAATSLTIAAGTQQVFTAQWANSATQPAGAYTASAWLTASSGSSASASLASAAITLGSTGSGDTTPPVFAGAASAQMYNGQLAVIATTVTWTAATDNVTPANQITYNIYRYSVDPRVMYFAQPRMYYNQPFTTAGAGQTGFMDTNVTTGGNVAYYYAVRAVDAASNEDNNTKEVSVVVP